MYGGNTGINTRVRRFSNFYWAPVRSVWSAPKTRAVGRKRKREKIRNKKYIFLHLKFAFAADIYIMEPLQTTC